MEFFSQYDLYNIFKIFTDGKKIFIDGNSHNIITKLYWWPTVDSEDQLMSGELKSPLIQKVAEGNL